MKGQLTLSNQREIVKSKGLEFLQDVKITIDEYLKDKKVETEIKEAIAKEELVCAPLASDSEIIASFEVEALVDDTVVLSFVDLSK